MHQPNHMVVDYKKQSNSKNRLILLLTTFLLITGLLLWEITFSQDTRSSAAVDAWCPPGQIKKYNLKGWFVKCIKDYSYRNDKVARGLCNYLETQKCITNNKDGIQICNVGIANGYMWGDCKLIRK